MIIHVRTAYLWETHDVSDDCTFGELKDFLSDRTGIPLSELELKVGYPARILHHPSMTIRIQDLGITSGTEIFVRPSPTKSLQADKLQQLGYPNSVINSVLEKTEFYPFEEVLEMCDDESVATKDSQSISPHRLQLERVSFSSPASSLLQCLCYLLQLPYDHTHVRNLISSTRGQCDDQKRASHRAHFDHDEELRALSSLFNVEIIVIDSRSMICLHYGKELREREWERNDYHKKILLLFDGTRYDAIIQRNLRTNQTTTQFVLDNETIVEDALEFIKSSKTLNEEKSKKPEVTSERELPKAPSIAIKTNTSRVGKPHFRCQICHKEILGEEEAKSHSELEHHLNFIAVL